MLNRLGLCKGTEASRKVVDDIRAEFDSKVRQWQQSIAKAMAGGTTDNVMRLRSDLPQIMTDQVCPGRSSFKYVVVFVIISMYCSS